MACGVLRCEQESTRLLVLSDIGIGDPAVRHEVPVCAEHHYRLTDGERCSWIDEDGVLVVGEDLDSGGHLVPVGWTVESAFGRTQVSIEVETPSGKEADPVRFLVPRDDRDKWWEFLLTIDTDTRLFGSSESP